MEVANSERIFRKVPEGFPAGALGEIREEFIKELLEVFLIPSLKQLLKESLLETPKETTK